MPHAKYKSFVPAFDDVIQPPPEPATEPPLVRNSVSSEAAWFISTLSIVLMTVVLIVSMLVDGSTAREAVQQGVKFFLGAIALVTVVLSGTLTDMWRGYQHEKTERRRIDAWADLGEQVIELRMAAEQNRRLELERAALPAALSRRLAALETELLEQRMEPALPQTHTFVSPYDNRRGGAFAEETQPEADTTAQEAIRWVSNTLYTDTGEINREHVLLDGKPEARGMIVDTDVIGSKRGPGSKEALRWLLDRHVLFRVPGGYALNVEGYPRRDDLRYIA